MTTMAKDEKSLLAKQIAFGYGIAISVIIGFVGALVISMAAGVVVSHYDDLVKAKEQYTNQTYLENEHISDAFAKEMIDDYQHSYDYSHQQGLTFIAVGMGLLVLAEIIAYVPMSLYAENGKELLNDHSKRKR